MLDLMAASVLISVAEDGGLWDLSGPYGGQRVFLQVEQGWREVNPAVTKGQQVVLLGEVSGSEMDWS